MKQLQLILGTLIGLMIIAAACSTVKRVKEEPEETETAETTTPAGREAFIGLLDANRSSLSDVFNSQQHDMPAHLTEKASPERKVARDPHEGFRIQILSTRNMELADSVSVQYRTWADTTITGYKGKAYVSFKQPFYKVHIGDFQDRERAIRYSRLIKKKYPDAWVVHDRIEPDSAPADTVRFELAADTLKQVNDR